MAMRTLNRHGIEVQVVAWEVACPVLSMETKPLSIVGGLRRVTVSVEEDQETVDQQEMLNRIVIERNR